MNPTKLKIVLAAVASTMAVAACTKTDSAPTGFGVNITVDATQVPADKRMKITSDELIVSSDKTGATPTTHVLDDLPTAIQGGTVRFHYTPGSGVTAMNTLTFGLNVKDSAGNIIASGASGAVHLAANAVEATIVLRLGGGTDGGGGDGGKTNGVACATSDECGSGFCTDGVCCNEKCDDVCASCNLSADTKGTCTPYAAGTDPEMECLAKNPSMDTDAGSSTVAEAGAEGGTEDGAAEGGTDSGPSTDGGGVMDASASDAFMINPPDGGVMNNYKLCGGTCDGTKRACKFPDKTTSCGTPFCNSRKDVVAFACDGMGSCQLGVGACTSYSCDEATGGCRTTCSDSSHCLPGFYCDGSTHSCVDQKGNGLTCQLANECKSGNCSGGAGTSVCCNTACDGQGLTCTEAGHIGSCQCQGVTCAAGVACQVFYQDADLDGFGNMNGTIAAGTAKAGCMGSTPPAGFVADNTDCDDTDAMAHPNQTMFFNVQRKSGGFDYDCDNKITKETPEYPGGVCKYCGTVGSCSTTSPTCADTTSTASFQCPQEYSGLLALSNNISPPSIEPLITPESPGAITSYLAPIGVVPPPICLVCTRQCCGCYSNDKSGFRQAVDCGDASVPMYTCGSCGTAPGGAPAMTPSTKQQRCR
jgi:hypothetical protein